MVLQVTEKDCEHKIYYAGFNFISSKDINRIYKQKRSTEGCSKFKSPETRQVQERLVSTLEHMQVPVTIKNRCNVLSMESVTVCGHHTECRVTFGRGGPHNVG